MAIILEKGGDTHRINLEKPAAASLLLVRLSSILTGVKGDFSKIYSAMPYIRSRLLLRVA